MQVQFTQRPVSRHPVVDCGVEPTGLRRAIRTTGPEGVPQSVSSYVASEVSLPLQRMYTLGIEFHIGRAHSAALLPEVVALVAGGRLQPGLVTTSIIDWHDAAERFTDPTVKLVISRKGPRP